MLSICYSVMLEYTVKLPWQKEDEDKRGEYLIITLSFHALSSAVKCRVGSGGDKG